MLFRSECRTSHVGVTNHADAVSRGCDHVREMLKDRAPKPACHMCAQAPAVSEVVAFVRGVSMLPGPIRFCRNCDPSQLLVDATETNMMMNFTRVKGAGAYPRAGDPNYDYHFHPTHVDVPYIERFDIAPYAGEDNSGVKEFNPHYIAPVVYVDVEYPTDAK